VQIVQNGAPTVRYTDDLKPLDFYHIERQSPWSESGAVVTKKPGSELERIDLTRHGLISDHIAGRYISRLRSAEVQQSLRDRGRRIGDAFSRAGLRRRKLDPPLKVASSR
jgi:hypothetical protein